MNKTERINLRIEKELKKKLEELAKKENRTVSNYIENLIKKEIKPMNTLQMQYEYSGEWFEIWETKQTELELALNEMDERPEEGGCIKFKNGKEILIVNGGF